MASAVKDQIVSFERALDRELSKHGVMLQLERRTGIKKTQLVGLALTTIVVLFLLRFIAEIVLAVVAVAYPAVMTVSAIEAHDKKADTHWLAYWLVLGLWSVLETLTGGALAALIPFYALLKVVACVWLFLPSTSGATLVYEKAIRPVALTVRGHPVVQELSKEANKTASRISQEATKAAKSAVASKMSGEAKED